MIDYFEYQDRLLIVYKNGTYITYKIDEDTSTLELLENIVHISKWSPEDIYTVVYTNGENKYTYGKRFKVTTQMDNKYYHFISNLQNSKLHFFSAQKNSCVKIRLIPFQREGVEPLVVRLDPLSFPEKKWNVLGTQIATRPAMSVVQVENNQLLLL